MAEETSSESTFAFLGRGYSMSVIDPGRVEVCERLRSGLFHVAYLNIGHGGVIDGVYWGVPFNADHRGEWRATMLTLIKSHGVLTLQEAARGDQD